MALPSRFSRLNLAAIFLFALSLLNIAIAAPLPDSNENANEVLVARTEQTLITEERYVQYLQKFFPKTENYLLYSGNSENQVKAFQAKNAGYYYYDDFFNAPEDKPEHPWYQFFNADTDMDDAEASSRAIIRAATKRIRVFGAAEYKTAGANSFFASVEIKIIQEKINKGELEPLMHMAKDATSPTDIIATEDGKGTFTWQKDYKEGTKNASGSYGICKRVNGGCDAPKVTPKSKSGSGKCKRGLEACDKPTGTTTTTEASKPTETSKPKDTTTSKGTTSKDTTSKDTTSKDTTSKDTTSKDTTKSKDTTTSKDTTKSKSSSSKCKSGKKC